MVLDKLIGFVRPRCTKRIVGHALFLLFLIGSYWLVSYFHVGVAKVVLSGLLGGASFFVTRFVFHERGVWVATWSAVLVVLVVKGGLVFFGDHVVSAGAVVRRFPVVLTMTAVEVVEYDSLEEEVESVEG
jgi:hypothetical protein